MSPRKDPWEGKETVLDRKGYNGVERMIKEG
jgi:hypothetical protein